MKKFICRCEKCDDYKDIEFEKEEEKFCKCGGKWIKVVLKTVFFTIHRQSPRVRAKMKKMGVN